MLVNRVPPILLLEDEADDASFVRRALEKASIKNPLNVCKTGGAGARLGRVSAETGDREGVGGRCPGARFRHYDDPRRWPRRARDYAALTSPQRRTLIELEPVRLDLIGHFCNLLQAARFHDVRVDAQVVRAIDVFLLTRGRQDHDG